MGGRAEGLACADPGARTPIGVSGNFPRAINILLNNGKNIIANSKTSVDTYLTYVSCHYILNCVQVTMSRHGRPGHLSPILHIFDACAYNGTQTLLPSLGPPRAFHT